MKLLPAFFVFISIAIHSQQPPETTIYYKLGESIIPIRISQYGSSPEIVYINLHDNEFTSVQAARKVLEKRGGTLIRLDNNNDRLIKFILRGQRFAFDPNRIFSVEGIKASLEENGNVNDDAIIETEKFGQRILELIPAKNICVVALHNNSDGGYSIKSYIPGGDRNHDVRSAYEVKGQDPDDIVFTTDSIIYEKMAESGYNSSWQDNERATKDGSLSIYCGERSLRYVNIETQHGRVNQYMEMLEKLLEILKKHVDN